MNDEEMNLRIGKKLRFHRTINGLSQERLGQMLGVSFQQIQKYEKGVNSIKASKLYEIAAHLNVPVEQFFDPLGDVSENEGQAFQLDEPSAESIRLMKHYQQIQDPGLKAKLLSLVRAMAEDKAMIE